MMTALEALDRLHRFEAAKRAETLTGSLLGLSLPERDRLLADEFERFEAELARALAQAAETDKPVELDAARISLTETGDIWRIHPDGRMEREYRPFPGFEHLAAQLGHPCALDHSRPVDAHELLRTAYHAFWSPSATNWQPTRLLEVEGETKATLLRLAGWPSATAVPALVLLRRDHYESLLGDVLEPYGLAVTAREESLDAGIFAETMAMSAISRGLSYQEHVWNSQQLADVTRVITEELVSRRAKLIGESDELETERAKIDFMLDYLAKGKYLPDSLMLVGHPASETPRSYEAFEALIDAHSTQRVASPTREFSRQETDLLWARTVEALPEHERACVKFAFFHWSENTPPAIGTAMFEALYGKGSDPESKQGGEGGLLTAVTVRDYLMHLASKDPEYVRDVLGAGWQSQPDAELQKATKTLGIRAQDIGRYLRERILRDGKYQVVNGIIEDTNGKPLSIPVLVRLNKSLASTFGNFFLKFQNTHPQNGVLLADTTLGEAHWVYRTVGKSAAVLTYMARAMGASAIIKTGPIDLARDEIARILADNLDDQSELKILGSALGAHTLLPAMTFQVGYPLAGSDVVEPGTPNEHTGYEERKRDKRPPRERFVQHYLPAL